MLADLAFFSFVELTDASQHGAYNRWHQLDHRPENLALPGVAWGDRWGRSRDSSTGQVAASPFEGTDYVAMYWFRSPVHESVEEWDRLGEASFQWGRGPIIPGVRRPLLGFFRPVKGYSAPRILLDPDVLPYRPNCGLHITLTQHDEPHGAQTHDWHAWEDRNLIPQLLEVPGVAGAWTFSFSHLQQHSTLPFDSAGAYGPGALRIRLLYLDEDVTETTGRILETQCAVNAGINAPAEVGKVLFSVPLKTIVPWQDW